VTDLASKVKRVALPPIAMICLFATWADKLWYDTSSPAKENVWAWLYWPALVATLLTTFWAILAWLPPRVRTVAVEYPWQKEIVRGLCGITCTASVVVLGRAAVFVRNENWYFEAAWAYSSTSAVVILTSPILTLLAGAALWPTTRAPERLRDLLGICFNAVAVYVLVQLWRFLSRVACEACCGPVP
jgi:hypothetical protein